MSHHLPLDASVSTAIFSHKFCNITCQVVVSEATHIHMYACPHRSMHKHKHIKLYRINCALNEHIKNTIFGILTVSCSSSPGDFFIL